jgi:hypothetical protein
MRPSLELHGLQQELNRCLRQIYDEVTTQTDVTTQRARPNIPLQTKIRC